MLTNESAQLIIQRISLFHFKFISSDADVQIAVLTFDDFNELDSLVVYSILNRNRMEHATWKASIVAPSTTITSLNGLAITAEHPLEFAKKADAVIIGSGIHTLSLANDPSILKRILLNPAKQLIASQCSGALMLAKLGFLSHIPACTDMTTKEDLEAMGVNPFMRRVILLLREDVYHHSTLLPGYY